jgi:CheY-like chemotaxis protein
MGAMLIVDDDADTREIYGLMLTQPGRWIACANDGEQALRFARVLHPSLILLDLMMPRMNGWEFLERKSTDPVISAIPAIVVSALSIGIPEHASHLLVKPADPARLKALVGLYC